SVELVTYLPDEADLAREGGCERVEHLAVRGWDFRCCVALPRGADHVLKSVRRGGEHLTESDRVQGAFVDDRLGSGLKTFPCRLDCLKRWGDLGRRTVSQDARVAKRPPHHREGG